MTIYQFNSLDEGEQMEAIWKHGVHIGERDEPTFRYILYSVSSSFFIELKYHRENNVLVRSTAFKTETLLEHYLPNIDISEILENL